MTDQDTAPNRNGAGPEPAEQAPAATESADTPDLFAVVEALNAENASLKDENASLKDRALRALADVDNLRKRGEREIADARTYGVTSFARDMLTVADNLRRALDAVPAEARAAAQGPLEGPLKALIEGIELTERDFLATLGRFGVKKLDPAGQKFDPNMHQAMFEVPDESVPSGTVTQVVQTGYAIGERVLRPALVGIAKGGPKAVSGAA